MHHLFSRLYTFPLNMSAILCEEGGVVSPALSILPVLTTITHDEDDGDDGGIKYDSRPDRSRPPRAHCISPSKATHDRQ